MADTTDMPVPIETTEKTNGSNNLPPSRQAAVVQAAEYLQEVAHARDTAQNEAARLRSDIAGYKIALEAKDMVIAELESRIASAYADRDQAVADRERYLAVCMSVNALMHTFEIPSKPLIRGIDDKTSKDSLADAYGADSG